MVNYKKSFDVVVCGGGIAGVAAAIECARAGMKTALVEKTVFTGGLATTGLVNIYLPICDGNGKQVSFGLAHELLHLANKYGPGDVPECWSQLKDGAEPIRYRLAFSPASYILALDEALQAAKVDIWLDTLACTPVMQGQKIVGVEVENKSGRGLLEAPVVIDATGDADIAFRAGAPCEKGTNKLSIWAIQEAPDTKDGLWTDFPTGRPAFIRRDGQPGRSWDGTDGKTVSEFLLDSRKIISNHYAGEYAKGSADRKSLFPVTLPTMAQFRTTRRIAGLETLQEGQDWKRVETSVGLVADWRRPGSVWEIPYATLLPQNVQGLLVAGRCMSSAGDAWEVTRVIPAAAVTGQACGAAAVHSIRQGVLPHSLQAAAIQQDYQKRGIPCHLEQIFSPEELKNNKKYSS